MPVCLLGALLAGAVVDTASGQELQRNSLVSARAAEGYRGTSLEETNYNLKVGPVRVFLSAYAGFEFNDNVGLSNTNRISDEAVRFGMNLRAVWAISRLNSLSIDIGLGIQRYLNNPGIYTGGGLTIAPNSQIAFDVFVADIFRLNFHDRFEVRQDPIESSTVSNVFNFGRFLNTAGVTLVADLNTIIATISYDHFNWVSLERTFDYLERADEQISGSVVYQIGPRTYVGAEGSYSISNYRQNTLNDSSGYSFGPYLDWAVSPYVRVVARGGFEHRTFARNVNGFGGLYADTSDLSSWYASLSVSQRINAYLSHNLSAGKTNELGYTANFNELYFVRYGIDWRAAKRVTIHGDAFYEHVKTSNSLLQETINRYGVGLSTSYDFSSHLSASFRYGYVRKDSNILFDEYYQNRVNLDLNYRF